MQSRIDSQQTVLCTVDTMNIVRRIYEAQMGPDTEERALATVRSSISSIRRAILETEASKTVCAFDAPGLTWRHALYPKYKAGRSPMPSVLREVLPELKVQLLELGVYSIEAEGYEADDIISELAMRNVGRPGVKVVVASTDKDMCQLIQYGVLIRDNFKREWKGAAWLQQKWKVLPEQLTDYFALVGDATDGVPGASGIGPVTAAKLLAEYGTLQGIQDAMPRLPGAQKQRLESAWESVKLSHQLISFRHPGLPTPK